MADVEYYAADARSLQEFNDAVKAAILSELAKSGHTTAVRVIIVPQETPFHQDDPPVSLIVWPFEFLKPAEPKG